MSSRLTRSAPTTLFQAHRGPGRRVAGVREEQPKLNRSTQPSLRPFFSPKTPDHNCSRDWRHGRSLEFFPGYPVVARAPATLPSAGACPFSCYPCTTDSSTTVHTAVVLFRLMCRASQKSLATRAKHTIFFGVRSILLLQTVCSTQY